jgi:hypothetical protein
MSIEFGTYGKRIVEPTVPLISSTGTKYCDCPGEENQTYSLAVPGTVIFTGFDVIDKPVPLTPVTLIGAGLQVVGWQTAFTEATLGKLVVIPPVEPTEMSMGSVDW